MRVEDVSVGVNDDSSDLVIASCGYERRASYVCRLGIRGQRMVALDYGGAGASYTENQRLFAAAGWNVIPAGNVQTLVTGGGVVPRSRRIMVDISSMPRAVLAALVEQFNTSLEPLEVTFVYAPGNFEESVKAAGRHEVLTAGPISDYFAGELRPTSVPVGLVVGLGLEQFRALGVTELLEPARTWIFTTYSGDERYREAADSIHRRMLDAFDPGAVFEYDVRSVADIYAALESLAFSAGLRYRLIMAPSGPKVFTLACLLVGARRSPARPAVWRVGGAGASKPFDISEAGDLAATKVSFEGSSDLGVGHRASPPPMRSMRSL